MKKLRAASLVELAQQEIERQIYDGGLPSGERVVIDRLARELGVSAITLREALAHLYARKLLAFEPNKGYSVRPPPTAEELAELFDVRLALEVGALELVSFPVHESDLLPIREINRRISKGSFERTNKGYRAFAELNLLFHKGVLALSRNNGLMETYQDLGYHHLIGRVVNESGLADVEIIAAQHDQILEALTHSSSDAARAILRAHIVGGKDRFIESYLVGRDVPHQ